MLKFFIFVATGFFISIQTKAQSADQPADPKSQVEQIQKNFTDKSAREKSEKRHRRPLRTKS